MAIHGVFESTNMRSTHYAERIFDAVAAVDLDNGTFGYLNGLAEGYSHIYNFVAGVPEDGQTLVVVDQPAWDYCECKKVNQRKDNFFIEAGTPFRCRVLHMNDEFAINDACVTPATREQLEVGATVTIDGDTGKLVAAEATETTDGFDVAETQSGDFAGVVMRKRKQGGTIVTSEHTYGNATELYTVKVTALG